MSKLDNILLIQEEPETISVILDPNKYPTAFKNKVDELMEQGVYERREDAEHFAGTIPIVLELVYEKHSGLFAAESEAIDANVCVSPYSQKDLITEESLQI